jgi:hypothetical protein
MELKSFLPSTQRIYPILDKDIKTFTENFFKNNFLCNYQDDKDVLLKKTRNIIEDYLSPVFDLSQFSFMCPTNGITEGLYNLSSEYHDKRIKVNSGDYDWLKINLRDKVTDHGEDLLYITNPSCINGNFINNDQWNTIINSHNNIALDCAYLGSTETRKIELNKNINYVYVGLSKMFGLQDLRIGFTFYNKINIAHHAIVKNYYYNNNNLRLTMELMQNFKLGYLHSKYKDKQKAVCQEYNINPSDVVYLAYTYDNTYDFYKRGDVNRLCITKLLI